MKISVLNFVDGNLAKGADDDGVVVAIVAKVRSIAYERLHVNGERAVVGGLESFAQIAVGDDDDFADGRMVVRPRAFVFRLDFRPARRSSRAS